MDAWRRDVADSASPVVIRRDDRAFRDGMPAPVQLHMDDGLGFKSNKTSTYDYEPTYSRRPKHTTRRSSSDHGYPRRSSLRTSSKVAPDYSYSKPSKYDSYERRPSSSKQGASIWSALFPSSRESRKRAMTNDRPLRRTRSPEYVYEREPEVTVYSHRPKSQYASPRAPRKEYVVNRSGTTKSSRSRRDSFGVDDRMRLLDIRDRVRDEVERAKEWREPKPRRRRDYDRRSSYY